MSGFCPPPRSLVVEKVIQPNCNPAGAFWPTEPGAGNKSAPASGPRHELTARRIQSVGVEAGCEIHSRVWSSAMGGNAEGSSGETETALVYKCPEWHGSFIETYLVLLVFVEVLKLLEAFGFREHLI